MLLETIKKLVNMTKQVYLQMMISRIHLNSNKMYKLDGDKELNKNLHKEDQKNFKEVKSKH